FFCPISPYRASAKPAPPGRFLENMTVPPRFGGGTVDRARSVRTDQNFVGRQRALRNDEAHRTILEGTRPVVAGGEPRAVGLRLDLAALDHDPHRYRLLEFELERHRGQHLGRLV